MLALKQLGKLHFMDCHPKNYPENQVVQKPSKMQLYKSPPVLCLSLLLAVASLCKAAELAQRTTDGADEVADFKAGFGNANIKLHYSISSSPMNTTHRMMLAKCLYNIRRGAIQFLTTVNDPEFSKMDYDWARETQKLFNIIIGEARDLGEAFVEDEERFSQIESVKKFFTEAAISLTTGNAPSLKGAGEEKTFSMEDFEDYLEELEEIFVRLTGLNWKISIPTVSINGVSLNEIIMEQVALLERHGLRKAVDGISSGVDEFWKVINEAHTKHVQARR